MSCPALEQLAAIAAGEVEDPHALACARCAVLIEEQRAVRELARSLRPPTLDGDRRTVLAAEVMARADALHHRPRIGRGTLAAGLVAVGAAVAMILVVRGSGQPAAPVAEVGHDPPAIEIAERAVVAEAAPIDPSSLAAELRPAADAELTRETTPARDLVTLRSGTVAVDAARTRAVEIRGGTTHVTVARARAQITARRGAIESVRVFAGSVEVIEGNARHVIVAGAAWERLRPPAATPATSMAAFREGWTALRAGAHARAIAAFDRATDPVVAEDASYWGAVASERAGRHEDARRRFTEFVARFPASPRVEAARRALAADQNMQR